MSGLDIMKTTTNDLSKYIISYFSNIVTNSVEGDLTNLKLQKLLYYVQVLSLKRCNTILFEEEIEAWSYGPVIPAIYYKYKIFGRNILEIDEPNLLLLDENATAIVDDVIKDKGRYTGLALMDMTHNERAWRMGKDSKDKIITEEYIRYDINATSTSD